MSTPTQPTPVERRRLAAEACATERTVRRIYAGKPAKPATWERIRRAAELLGLPPPPAAKGGS